MNPVLASSVEFDNYLKSCITSSSKNLAKRSRAPSLSESKDIPRSTSTTKPHIKALTSTSAAKVSTLQHSWARHLNAKSLNGHSPIKKSLIIPQTKPNIDDNFDWNSPQGPRSFKLIDETLSFTMTQKAFLKSYFSKWRDHVNSSKLEDIASETIRRRELERLFLRSIFRSWNSWFKAIKSSKARMWRRFIRRYTWVVKKSIASLQLAATADLFFETRAMAHGFMSLSRHAYKLQRRRDVERIVSSNRQGSMIRRFFDSWRGLFKDHFSRRQLDVESKERKDKIRSFVSKVQSQRAVSPRKSVAALSKGMQEMRLDDRSRSMNDSISSMNPRSPPPPPYQPKSTAKDLPEPLKSSRRLSTASSKSGPAPRSVSASRPQRSRSTSVALSPQKRIPPSPSKKMTSRLLPPPPPSSSTQNLDERAKERKARMIELKKKAEEKKVSKQASALEERRRKEEAELKELEDFRRKKREDQARVQAESELFREKHSFLTRQIERAIDHHNRQIIIRCGFAPWIKLIQSSKRRWFESCQHRYRSLLSRGFFSWKAFHEALSRDRIQEERRKTLRAASHCRLQLVRRMWTSWARYRKVLRSKAKAIHTQFFGLCIRRRSFRAWKLAMQRTHRREALALRRVESRGNQVTMRFYWKLWKDFLVDERLEREIRHRSAATWNKVQGWLHHK